HAQVPPPEPTRSRAFAIRIPRSCRHRPSHRNQEGLGRALPGRWYCHGGEKGFAAGSQHALAQVRIAEGDLSSIPDLVRLPDAMIQVKSLVQQAPFPIET